MLLEGEYFRVRRFGVVGLFVVPCVRGGVGGVDAGVVGYCLFFALDAGEFSVWLFWRSGLWGGREVGWLLGMDYFFVGLSGDISSHFASRRKGLMADGGCVDYMLIVSLLPLVLLLGHFDLLDLVHFHHLHALQVSVEFLLLLILLVDGPDAFEPHVETYALSLGRSRERYRGELFSCMW